MSNLYVLFSFSSLHPEVHQTTKAAGLDKHVIKLICGQYGRTQAIESFFGKVSGVLDTNFT